MKPDKAQIVSVLEKHLTPEDKISDPNSRLITHGIIDFMSAVMRFSYNVTKCLMFLV